MTSVIEKLGGLTLAYSQLMSEDSVFSVAKQLADDLYNTNRKLPNDFFSLLPLLVMSELAKRGRTQSDIAVLLGDYSTSAVQQHRSRKGRQRQEKKLEAFIQKAVRTSSLSHLLYVLERKQVRGYLSSPELHLELQCQLSSLGCELTCERIEADIKFLESGGYIANIEGVLEVRNGFPPEPALVPILAALRSHYVTEYILEHWSESPRKFQRAEQFIISTQQATQFIDYLRCDRPIGTLLDHFNCRSSTASDYPMGYSIGVAIRCSSETTACDPVDHLRMAPLQEELTYSLSTVSPSMLDELFAAIPTLFDQLGTKLRDSSEISSLESQQHQLSLVATELPGDSRL